MSLLNPIVAKFLMNPGVAQEVYMCPNTKSHAVVDLTFFKNDTTTSSKIAVALASESNPGALTMVDYFIDDIELIGEVNSAELTKVMVGAGERLFIQVLDGSPVSVRISGVEENNSKVLKAGRLAAAAVNGTSQVQVFDSSVFANAAYTSTSITIFNTSNTENAKVEMWISSSATPTNADKVMMVTIPMEDTTIVENVLLLPNEKIFVASEVAGVEYFVNGVVIRQ
jgi:hypothetical protein